jgi:YD repeat-containing protein
VGRLLRVRAPLIGLLALLGLASAAEPVLGPDGWARLGPVPTGSGRDEVVFDPETCAVEVSRVDLDGGPAFRDVRLARVWTATGWRWADDWVVRDGRLLRPGRAAVPVGPDRRHGDEVLTLDGAGRVVARTRAGRRVEVLRDESGAFRGMRSGRVDVRIEGAGPGDEGVASDGRTVRWRWEGPDLRSVGERDAAASLYTYDGKALLTGIAWADGARLTVERTEARTRTAGVGGGWTCEVRTDGAPYRRVSLVGPAGTWTFERVGDLASVTDPTGGTTRTRWADGRVAGWIDPRGGETRLTRDPAGRVVDVTDPAGGRWELAWADGGLGAVAAPDGARWRLGTDGVGGVVRVDEPSGRSETWERAADGRARGVGVGTARWSYQRDTHGRVLGIVDPVGAAVTLARDAAGRVVAVTDGAGGAWRVARDGEGRGTVVSDPGGGRWEIARDGLGRVTGVRDPTGAWTRWTLRETGEPERVTVGSQVWTLLWRAPGVLTGLRDPLGRTTSWTRDDLGRAREIQRADGSVVALLRDAAGDLIGVGEAKVRRDAAGRALGVDLGAATLAWDRDVAGRVVGVSGPGVALGLGREPGGALREVRVEGSAPVRLTRDGQGRVVRAEGEMGVDLVRDAAGRIVALSRQGRPSLRVERDRRGLPARLVLDDRVWTIGRDATGRIVSLGATGDVRLGVDRDVAGRPALARFPTGALARFEYDGDNTRVGVTDRDGGALGTLGWTLGPAGALARLQAAATWLFRRDPLGTLVAVESGDDAWSSAPDGVEGPGGSFVRYDSNGRPAAARLPSGWGGAWGLGEGDLTYELDGDGAIGAIRGARGEVRLRYDGVGRLVAWSGLDGGTVARDALGRLAAVGRVAIDGWEGLRGVGGEVRVGLAGLGAAWRGGGALFAPSGVPLLAVPGGVATSAPGGALSGVAARDDGAGGRFQSGRNGPLLGLADGLDPVTGQPLAAAPTWPWAPRAWEATVSDDPLADPDGAARSPAWDPGPWAPTSPWSDPLALLVAAGELPSGGPRASAPPGLPWLPASLAPGRPAPVPDPMALDLDEEPLIAWIVGHARAPTTAPAPADVAALFLSEQLPAGLLDPPGLTLPLPEALAAAYSNRNR